MSKKNKNKVVILNNESDQDMDDKLSMLDYIASLKSGTAKGSIDDFVGDVDNKIISNVSSIIKERDRDRTIPRQSYKEKEVSLSNFNRDYIFPIEKDVKNVDFKFTEEEERQVKKYHDVTESLFADKNETKIVEREKDDSKVTDDGYRANIPFSQEELEDAKALTDNTLYKKPYKNLTNDQGYSLIEEDEPKYQSPDKDQETSPVNYGVSLRKIDGGGYILTSKSLLPYETQDVSGGMRRAHQINITSGYIERNLPKNQFIDKEQYEAFIVDSIEFLLWHMAPTMVLPSQEVYDNESYYARVKECNYSGYKFYELNDELVAAYKLDDSFYDTFESLTNDETVNLLYVMTKYVRSQQYAFDVDTELTKYWDTPCYLLPDYSGLKDTFTHDFEVLSEAEFVPSNYVDPEIDGVDIIDGGSYMDELEENIKEWEQMLTAVPTQEVKQASTMNNYLNNRVEKPTVKEDNVDLPENEPVEHKLTTEHERNLFNLKPKVQEEVKEEVKEKVVPSTPVAEKENNDSDSLLPEGGSFVDTSKESSSDIVHVANDTPEDSSGDIIIPTIRKR